MDNNVIKGLNYLLNGEIIAVQRYLIYSSCLKSQGYNKLADLILGEVEDERKHIINITDRIIFLGAVPECAEIKPFTPIIDVESIIKSIMDMESLAIESYQNYIKAAEDMLDYGTVELLADILVDEERHYDYLRKQLDILAVMGPGQYLHYNV